VRDTFHVLCKWARGRKKIREGRFASHVHKCLYSLESRAFSKQSRRRARREWEIEREREREGGRQRGARGQGAASSELRQKTKIRTENSIWSTTSESARGMSPLGSAKGGTCLGEARKVPSQVRRLVGTCPRASRKCPLSGSMHNVGICLGSARNVCF
jgi:hypothetical protein